MIRDVCPTPPPHPELSIGAIETEELLGFVEVCSSIEIRGWVIHKQHPEWVLEAVVECQSRSHHTPVAAYRADLHEAGMRNPSCGFDILLIRLTHETTFEEPQIPARFLVRHNNRTLHQRDFVLRSDLACAGRYQWALDVLRWSRIAGWVVDRVEDQPVWLEVENPRTKMVANARADCFRPDLLKPLGRQTGGFDIALGWDVRMRASSFNLFALERGERVLLCDFQLPALFGTVDAIDKDGFVEGWAINAGDPALRPLVEILVDEKVTHAAHATIYRSDLEKLTGEDGFFGYRFVMPEVDRDSVRVRISLPSGETMII